jgi:hypothetical protein
MLSEARDLEYLDAELEQERAYTRRRLRAVDDVERGTSARWLADVSDLPAHLIGDLSVPLTVRMRAIDGSTFYLSTIAAEREMLLETGAIVLDRDEWAALVLATEADRAWPPDLVRALRGRGTSGRLSSDALLDGITVQEARRDAGRLLTMGRVLARLGARLEAVWVEDAGSEARTTNAVFP